MKNLFKRFIKPFYRPFKRFLSFQIERNAILLGSILSEKVKQKINISSLSEVGFQVFSQFDEDGIIQWLIHHLEISESSKIFVEFGVENYTESNTRFLLMKDYWKGLVMDASEENIKEIKNSYYYWKYPVKAKRAWITAENINELIKQEGIEGEIGILSIDIDGMDYWVWKAITVVKPIIVIVEYNAFYGIEKSITVPYDSKFNRFDKHPLYSGASLKALYKLGKEKGYAFVGCSSGGVNAFFVRCDKINSIVHEVSLQKGFRAPVFRERVYGKLIDHCEIKRIVEEVIKNFEFVEV